MASTIFPPDRVTIIGVQNPTPHWFSAGGRQLGAGGRLAAARRTAAVAFALRRERG